MSPEETPQTDRRNAVLIHLESTRARSVTPYNQDLKTTPFLDEQVKSSLLVERAYTTVSRTSKAIISVNRGIRHISSRRSTRLTGRHPIEGTGRPTQGAALQSCLLPVLHRVLREPS